MRPENEGQRYNISSFLVGWAHSQSGPWTSDNLQQIILSKTHQDAMCQQFDFFPAYNKNIA